MLVLSRYKDEVVRINDNIRVMVIEVRGDKVRLGFDAPRDVSVHREEIWLQVQKQSIKRSGASPEQTPDSAE